MKTPSNALGDENLAAVRKRLEEGWQTVRAGLWKLARRRLGNEALADDMVADCYLAIYTGQRAWDLEKEPKLKGFAGSTINSMCSNSKTAAANRRADLGDEDGAPISQHPERVTTDAREVERWQVIEEALHRELGGEEKARDLLALGEAGIHSVAEQAERLGLTHDQTKHLRRRVRAVVDALAEEIE